MADYLTGVDAAINGDSAEAMLQKKQKEKAAAGASGAGGPDFLSSMISFILGNNNKGVPAPPAQQAPANPTEGPGANALPGTGNFVNKFDGKQEGGLLGVLFNMFNGDKSKPTQKK